MKHFILYWILVFLISGCGEKKDGIENSVNNLTPTSLSGSQLAMQYCGKCHVFPGPEQLPKYLWEKEVLPSMGFRMGIFKGKHQPDSLFEPGLGGRIVKKANIFPSIPIIAREDWQKIIDYYLTNAPHSLPIPQKEKPIATNLSLFNYKESQFSIKPVLTTMVKILPNSKGVVFADGKKNVSSLVFLNKKLKKDYDILMKTSPVHFSQVSDTILLTTIGEKMYPHDAPKGAIQQVFPNQKDGLFNGANLIVQNMQRPVDAVYEDLNGDGLEDIVACEYGNLTGRFVWYENQGDNKFQIRPLKNEAGAIKTIVKDVDEDGKPDIMVLMAQGAEGIYLFRNLGDGKFKETKTLTFSPLNGSQYFELVDFNGDGKDDILYTCGDNADYSPILKSYHGIYLFENKGNNTFQQAYFFHQNGAYKAIARDFDLDGDLDIASISFFPDYRRTPEEAFIYLENKGNLNFQPYSFPEVTNGRWMVMDAEDMDNDGDTDLALGSFVGFIPEGDTTGLHQKWIKRSPSIIVLENTTK
ncbi:FG-GAP repeat domain-containing protein [Flexithrix dorotheae]|uniref:FG-GAP repeat domain-containing protein n=1 Tax=Flexithrix dorotheae TaxID=70993 RepID=UPI00036E6F68|nr:VCBS repeat-containing protein [Flexithrix dorotheae]